MGWEALWVCWLQIHPPNCFFQVVTDDRRRPGGAGKLKLRFRHRQLRRKWNILTFTLRTEKAGIWYPLVRNL